MVIREKTATCLYGRIDAALAEIARCHGEIVSVTQSECCANENEYDASIHSTTVTIIWSGEDSEVQS